MNVNGAIKGSPCLIKGADRDCSLMSCADVILHHVYLYAVIFLVMSMVYSVHSTSPNRWPQRTIYKIGYMVWLPFHKGRLCIMQGDTKQCNYQWQCNYKVLAVSSKLSWSFVVPLSVSFSLVQTVIRW